MTDKKFTWSYSSMSTYFMCPFKWNQIKNFGIVEPESYFLAKGLEAHAHAENYLLDKIESVPTTLSKFSNEFKNLKKNNAVPEESWSIDSNWQIIQNTDEQDAWTHDDVWCRMKLDARIDNYIVDFKTGKHYVSHEEQANLYATTHLANSDDKEVHVEFWYLKDGSVKFYEYNRNDLQMYKDMWEAKVSIMQNDTEFLPKKNDYCKYCHVRELCPLF